MWTVLDFFLVYISVGCRAEHSSSQVGVPEKRVPPSEFSPATQDYPPFLSQRKQACPTPSVGATEKAQWSHLCCIAGKNRNPVGSQGALDLHCGAKAAGRSLPLLSPSCLLTGRRASEESRAHRCWLFKSSIQSSQLFSPGVEKCVVSFGCQ